jgi:hypothetical protein
MKQRKDLEADLAKAETDLAKAMIEKAKVDSDPAKTIAERHSTGVELDKARVNFALARATLAIYQVVRHHGRGSTGQSDEPEGPSNVSPSGIAPRQNGPFDPGRRVDAESEDLRDRSTRDPWASPDEMVHWIKKIFSTAHMLPAIEPLEKATPTRRLVARQAMMFFALVLAYLQYYFLDVHLQIARLPNTFLTGLG